MKNITIDELRERLDNLRNGSRSGVISFMAGDGVGKDDVDFWGNHISMVYFSEIGILWAISSGQSAYCSIDSEKGVSSLLEEYLVETDRVESDLTETGLAEPEYIDQCYSELLWALAHDWEECPDLDLADSDSEYVSYNVSQVRDWKAMEAFRICGGRSVADDIRAFAKLIETGETFTVSGKDGKSHQFAVNHNEESWEFSDYETTYSLNLTVDDTYEDETEGPIPVRRYYCLLHALELGTIYAKSRTFIFVNFVEQ